MMPSGGLQAIKGKAPRLFQQQCRTLSSRPTPRTSPLRYSRASIQSPQWRTQTPMTASNFTAVRYASTTPTTPSPGPASAPQAPITEPSSAAATSSTSSQFPNLDTITLDDVQLASNPDYLSVLPEQIGYLKSIGLNYGIGPTSGIEWILEHLHVWGGLPWWGAIAGTAIVIRLALLPFFIKSADQTARQGALIPITKPITDRMSAAQKAGDQTGVMEAWREVNAVRSRAGLSYFQQFTPMILQAITGFCGFRLLTAAANLPVPGFQDGGFLWLSNLTISDPYILLPALMAATIHIMVRFGGETGSQNAALMAPGMRTFMLYGMPTVVLLITGWQSGAVCVWFATGGAIGMCQALAFQNPAVRKVLGIAPLYKPAVTPQKSTDSAFKPLTDFLNAGNAAQVPPPRAGGAAKNTQYMRPTYQSPNVRTTRGPRTIDTTATSRSYNDSRTFEAAKKEAESSGGLLGGFKKFYGELQERGKIAAENRRKEAAKRDHWELEERLRKKREIAKREGRKP